MPSPHHTVSLSVPAQRILEELAIDRLTRHPDAFGALGHLPNLLAETVAVGLATLAKRSEVSSELKFETHELEAWLSARWEHVQ